jgi:putative hydrolase of the HAD superfamily
MFMATFDCLAFDADDTLWHSEDGFHAAEVTFCEFLAPYVPAGIDVMSALVATERANLPVYGYGVKGFGLSMIEAAITISQGRVPTEVLSHLLQEVRDLLLAPVRLIDGVPEVLQELAQRHRLILITKGDLVHQTRKVTTSGLEHLFDHVEIVLEKDVATYAKVFRDIGVQPDRVCMVGNSIKSDILPILELGGHAVHIPYPFLWELEKAEHHPVSPRFVELTNIDELPACMSGARFKN